MIARFFNFSKRKNSTKRPNDADGTDITVRLKDDTSLENPVFEISGRITQSYNYLKWDNRYYFINDVISKSNAIIEYHCSTDVLATYKNDIGAYNCYVERTSDRTQYDELIKDHYISSSTDIIKTDVKKTELPFLTTGVFSTNYLVRVVNGYGIIDYATNNPRGFLNSLFPLVESTDYGAVFERDYWKSTYNPFSYVLKIYYLPILSNYVTGVDQNVQTVQVGMLKKAEQPPFVITRVFDEYVSDWIELNKPTPQYSDFRAYDNNWTMYSLYIPSIGQIDIPAHLLQDDIYIKYYIDLRNGATTVQLANNTTGNSLIGTYRGNISVDVQIGDLGSNTASAISSMVGSFASIGGSNPISLITSGINATNNIFEAYNSMLHPPMMTNGSNTGNVAELTNLLDVVFTSTCVSAKNIPTSVLGRPCCKNLTLGSLSGYIKCNGASISIAGTESERTTINNYLNGGFYYE